jgi:hypothetical protein
MGALAVPFAVRSPWFPGRVQLPACVPDLYQRFYRRLAAATTQPGSTAQFHAVTNARAAPAVQSLAAAD